MHISVLASPSRFLPAQRLRGKRRWHRFVPEPALGAAAGRFGSSGTGQLAGVLRQARFPGTVPRRGWRFHPRDLDHLGTFRC